MSEKILSAIKSLKIDLSNRIETLESRVSKQIKDFRDEFDGYTSNTGALIEDSFENFLKRKKQKNITIKKLEIIEKQPIKFETYERNIIGYEKKERIFQLDFLLINSKYLGIAEIKRNILKKDVDKFLNESIPKFIENYKYKKYTSLEILPIFISRVKINEKVIEYSLSRYSNFKNLFFMQEENTQKFEVI